MSARTVLAFVAAAGLGWVARGVSLNAANAAPAVHKAPAACPNPEAIAAVAALAAPAAPSPNSDDDEEAATPDPDDENSGDDVGDLLAKAHAAVETHNGVHGVVTDQASGSPLPGATVLLYTPGGGAQTAVTNNEGEYSFADVEAGTYTVSFYYINAVTEHPNITINSFDSTTLSERLDTSQAYRHRECDDCEDYVFDEE